jgi:hypothetical protein
MDQNSRFNGRIKEKNGDKGNIFLERTENSASYRRTGSMDVNSVMKCIERNVSFIKK